MGLGFLTPGFLVGAVALAIPILIHLTNRERREVVAFPSLMFLSKIPYRSVRRQKLRHWLLFAMRCLALLLLVIAFARPLLDRPGAAVGSIGTARELVVLIDRSYSMGYEDRWDRALSAARRVVDDLQVGDRATLVFFSDEARAAHSPTSDQATLAAILDEAELGSDTTRYGPAFRLGRKILDGSRLPRREVVLITDFQRVGWQGREDVSLPAGTELRTVDLSDAETSNLSVTSVGLERDSASGRERIAASARLTNKGSQAFPDHPVELELNGRLLRRKSVTLEPNSSATVRFEPFGLPDGISRGAVRIANDALPADNEFYFVVWPGQSVSVLIVEDPQVSSRRSLYLRRVLSVGERPSFRVQVKKSTTLGRGDLNEAVVVFWNDAPAPSRDISKHLYEWVEAGGGLVVALGEDSEAWAGSAAALLPASWSKPVDRSADWGGTLSYLDYDHPIFEIFNAPRSGDFSAAKFFRYRALDLDRGSDALGRFDDGAVAMSEREVGDGRALIWASTLDTFWNDLALQPVFLPFVHQLVKYASGYVEAAAWHAVGDVVDLSRHLESASEGPPAAAGSRSRTISAPAELVAVAPSGETLQLSRQEGSRLLTLSEQGFYDLRYPRSGQSFNLAANLNLAESNLVSVDPEELAAAVTANDTRRPVGGRGEWTGHDPTRSQLVWWYLLAVAMLMLVMETVLSNRLSSQAKRID